MVKRYKSSISPRIKGIVEWQLEHYWQDKQNIEQYWSDSTPSPTPMYTDSTGGGEAERKTESTALRIASTPYIQQTERSCKAIENVLNSVDAIDKKLIRLVYWQQTHTVEGAAQVLHMSQASAYRHINGILCAIALEMGYISK